jgi:hypothetical protein
MRDRALPRNGARPGRLPNKIELVVDIMETYFGVSIEDGGGGYATLEEFHALQDATPFVNKLVNLNVQAELSKEETLAHAMRKVFTESVLSKTLTPRVMA